VLVTYLLLLAGLGAAAGGYVLGPAGWHALALWQAAIIFPLLAAAIAILALVAVRQMVPGARQPVSPWLAIGGAGVLILAAYMLLFPHLQDAHFVTRGLRCWGLGLLSAAVAGMLFAFILRRSAWLSPPVQGAAAGFLSGLVGLLVLEISCPFLDRAHRGIWHFGSALTAAFLGAGLAVLAKSVTFRAPDAK